MKKNYIACWDENLIAEVKYFWWWIWLHCWVFRFFCTIGGWCNIRL